jgi:hypothetical protein
MCAMGSPTNLVVVPADSGSALCMLVHECLIGCQDSESEAVRHCSGLTPRRIVTQYQGIKRRSRSVFQTTPGQARNGYQQGSYHPRGRKLLESRQGTAVRQLSTNLASFRATYTNMVDTSSSAVPNSQDTANKMAYDDCNHCVVPNEATCNHGTANTPCRSTYTSQSVIAFLRGG